MSSFDGKYEFTENPKSAIFNRSLTIHSTEKSYNLYNSQFERSGSLKKVYNSSFDSVKGKVRKLCSLFESPKPTSNSISLPPIEQSPCQLKTAKSFSPSSSSVRLPGTEDRVVVYLTSLRGIRRTFEDCYSVRMILRGFRVFVDERDISMDSAYKKELQSVLGGGGGGEKKNVSLPQVFIRGEYIGGADVIKQLHEIGELAKTLKGLPVRKPGYVCETCGDARFVPCANCSGSRKVFDEDDDQLKRCPECNENGLIRCPTCCCS